MFFNIAIYHSKRMFQQSYQLLLVMVFLLAFSMCSCLLLQCLPDSVSTRVISQHLFQTDYQRTTCWTINGCGKKTHQLLEKAKSPHKTRKRPFVSSSHEPSQHLRLTVGSQLGKIPVRFAKPKSSQ